MKRILGILGKCQLLPVHETPNTWPKTSFAAKKAKFSHFLFVFSNCMIKPKKFNETPDERAGERSVKTNMNSIIENNDTINSPTVDVDMFNIKFVNFATPVDGPNTQELEECFRKTIKMKTRSLPSQLI